jgi:hypothetical protein
LKLGSGELAGVVLLGTAGCGGGQSGAIGEVIFSNYEDPSFQKLVN